MGSPHRERSSHQGRRSYRGRKDFRGRAHSVHDVVYDEDDDEYNDDGSVYSYSDADDGYCEQDDCDDYDDHAVAAHTSSYSRDDTQPVFFFSVFLQHA